MTIYIALVRGINVGGRNKLAMADLRAGLESLGHTDVASYLQSGNAVFTAGSAEGAGAGRLIEREIAMRSGVEARVLVVTSADLAGVIAANPFPEATSQPSRLVVSFLERQPDAARVASIDPEGFAPDEFRVGDLAVYAWYPQGVGRSKLAGALERRLGVVGTARNWSTVTHLAAMAGALDGRR